MVLELHAWGPAFGLPSIDPDCIALIALLSLPLSKNLEWKLVISHDPSSSPTGEFPLLRHNGKTVAGFRAIVQELQRRHNDVDDGLSENERATVAGIVAHLRLRAHPLLDAHLYADGDNYVRTTRPAFSRILPFPYTWITPPFRAERAATRSSHLANQSSSLLPFGGGPSAPAPETNEPSVLQNTTSPSLLFARSEKARAKMAQQVSVVRLRLNGAVDALCEPLAELLALDNDRRGGLWLVRGKLPTSADCLAFGYLGLLLEPDVPNNAVTEMMNERWPRVVQYYRTLKGVLSLDTSSCIVGGIYKMPTLISSDDPYSTRQHAASMEGLPWFRAQPPTIVDRVGGIMQMIVNAIVSPEAQRRLLTLLRSGSVPLITGFAAGSSVGAASIAYAVYTLTQRGKPGGMPRVLVFAAERAARGGGFGQFGQAGAMLGLTE